MMNKESISRLMQLSALLLLLLGMGLGPMMITVQGPLMAPARNGYNEAVKAVQDQLAVEGMSGAMHEEQAGEGGTSGDMSGDMDAGMMSQHNAVVSMTEANAQAIVADAANNRAQGMRKGTRVAHAHANLESIWVFAASLVLVRLSIPFWLTGAVGGSFIIGSWFHGGGFTLNQYGIDLGMTMVRTGLGPILLMLGAGLLALSILWHWRANGPGDAR